jgi:bifunctional DNA-binding transcriptional regulator/antitoxin component of YhaV-PrlF toxin-antitoxin module
MMAISEVIKITSKGQLTLPIDIRKELSLDKDSYLYVTKVGSVVVMKKVEKLSLDEISTILQSLAEEGGITRNFLMKEVERAKKQLQEEKHAKSQG